MDFLKMMSKAKEMQTRMGSIQDELAEIEVAGASGGGLVTVLITGKGMFKSIKIDPSLLKPDEVEILEDLIIAAQRDAQAKQEAAVAAKMQELTAGLGLPPGMKLPF
jgi:DNA-binding YbaB/EbfC family protein